MYICHSSSTPKSLSFIKCLTLLCFLHTSLLHTSLLLCLKMPLSSLPVSPSFSLEITEENGTSYPDSFLAHLRIPLFLSALILLMSSCVTIALVSRRVRLVGIALLWPAPSICHSCVRKTWNLLPAPIHHILSSTRYFITIALFSWLYLTKFISTVRPNFLPCIHS